MIQTVTMRHEIENINMSQPPKSGAMIQTEDTYFVVSALYIQSQPPKSGAMIQTIPYLVHEYKERNKSQPPKSGAMIQTYKNNYIYVPISEVSTP